MAARCFCVSKARPAGSHHDDSSGDETDAAAQMLAALQPLKVSQLKARCRELGASQAELDAADDDDSPRDALIAIIASRASAAEPEQAQQSSLQRLQAGGTVAAELVESAVEGAVARLERCARDEGREARRSLRALAERAETLLDTIDDGWCDGAARCSSGDLAQLCSLLEGVDAVSADLPSALCALLDWLDHCGSTAVQTAAALGAGAPDERQGEALAALRELPRGALDAPSAAEVAVFASVYELMLDDGKRSGDERIAAGMATFTLGCRNGAAVLSKEEVYTPRFIADWEAAASVPTSELRPRLRLLAMASSLDGLILAENAAKAPPDSRAQLTTWLLRAAGETMRAVGAAWTNETAANAAKETCHGGLAEVADLALAAGAIRTMHVLLFLKVGATAAAVEAGIFAGAVAVHERLCPSPLPPEAWIATSDIVDHVSSNLGSLWALCLSTRNLPADAFRTAWWPRLMDAAVHIVQCNAQAGLSGRPTMSFFCIANALATIEAASKHECQHEMVLRRTQLVDALEYATCSTFTFIGINIASCTSNHWSALTSHRAS